MNRPDFLIPNRDFQPFSLEMLLDIAPAVLKMAGIPLEEARAEARLLLIHALGLTREELWTKRDYTLSREETNRFAPLLMRRMEREPLAYLLGERDFYGLTFTVTPAVLIPRSETELLVETVLAYCKETIGGIRIADIGTGSGCIAVSLAKHLPDCQIIATDISTDALAVAAQNADQHGVVHRITFRQGDLCEPLIDKSTAGLFDVIVSNPPYIASSVIETLQPEVRDSEPLSALDGGADGLAYYRRLAVDALPLLREGGLLLVEVGHDQADAVTDLWRGAGLTDVSVAFDLANIGRVVSGRKSSV